MKLRNKLLPILTIGSIGAVVAPMVTSCSSGIVFSTDLNFAPGAQHEASVGLLTQEEVVTDYFSTKQHFCEDLAYHRLTHLVEWVDEQLEPYRKDPNYFNASGSCTLSVEKMDMKTKVASRLIHGNEGDFDSYGCQMDLVLSFKSTYQYSYTVPKEGLGEGIEKEIDITSVNEEYSIDIYNCYAYIYWSGFNWEIGLYVDPDLDWHYTTHSATNEQTECRVTKSGKEEVVTFNNVDGNDSADSRGIECDGYAEVLEDNFYGTIVSYYLAKINPKD